jgi:hypothetical protein
MELVLPNISALKPKHNMMCEHGKVTVTVGECTSQIDGACKIVIIRCNTRWHPSQPGLGFGRVRVGGANLLFLGENRGP